MTEKKAVLNVTVAESVAEAVRSEAAARDVTISSVVEAALAEQLRWYQIRAEGLAAIEEEYRETQYPDPGARREASAAVAEQMRELGQILAEEAGTDGLPATGAA